MLDKVWGLGLEFSLPDELCKGDASRDVSFDGHSSLQTSG